MKINDKYRLRCGHLGVVVGVYDGGMAVKGNTKKLCDRCSKRLIEGKNWERMPTVFIISREKGGE